MPGQTPIHSEAIDVSIAPGVEVVRSARVCDATIQGHVCGSSSLRRRRGIALAQWPAIDRAAIDHLAGCCPASDRPAIVHPGIDHPARNASIPSSGLARRRPAVESHRGWPTDLPSLAAGPKEATSSDARLVLIAATAAFTLCFAVWVMFAIIGISMRKEFAFSEAQFALLVALPILTGSILRVPVGLIADVVGGRVMMIGLLLATAVPTFLVSRANTYDQALILSAFVGLAGTTFAAGAAWVSNWYPSTRQGFALGIFGAGNVGASITKLLAPTLVTLVGAGGLAGGLLPGGWRFVPATYAILLAAAAVAIYLATPDSDHRPSRGRSAIDMLKPLGSIQAWRFGLYYVTVFGAYVGLALWLPKYYVEVYGAELITAGMLTALFIFPASLLRPVGGALADRIGARSVTCASLATIGMVSAVLCLPMGMTAFTALIVTIGVAMGIGKASVYAYIPKYFPGDVGAAAGLVGAIGGLGGFVLPLSFAWITSATGAPQSTFAVMFALAIASLGSLATAVARISRRREGQVA